jgi:hypothetical protein
MPLLVSIVFSALLLFLLQGKPTPLAEVRRVILIKADGIPFNRLDQFVKEQDPETGKSRLPWLDHLFYQSGTRLENFYTRGISLSGPAWSILDTGQPLRIKGNIEFNRLTGESYDYLNFFLLFLRNAGGRQVDMPGVEMLDFFGIPLLADAYSYEQRHVSMQMFQRGTRLKTLQRGLQKYFSPINSRHFIDEWTLGFEGGNLIFDQLEHELLDAIRNPALQYLDYFSPQYDHLSHLNRDRGSQLYILQKLDQFLAGVWTEIQASPLADSTVLVLVSDHGTILVKNSIARVIT